MGDLKDENAALKKKLERYIHAMDCVDRDVRRAAERYLSSIPVPGGTINFIVFLDLLEKQIRQEAVEWILRKEIRYAIRKKLEAIGWQELCEEREIANQRKWPRS